MGASKHAVNPLSLSLRVVEDSGINVLFSLVGRFFGSNPTIEGMPNPKYAQAIFGYIWAKFSTSTSNIFKQILRPFHTANLRSPLCISRRFDPLVHGPWRVGETKDTKDLFNCADCFTLSILRIHTAVWAVQIFSAFSIIELSVSISYNISPAGCASFLGSLLHSLIQGLVQLLNLPTNTS